MAPRQTKATKVHQQRVEQPQSRKSSGAKLAVKQARRRLLTKRATNTGSKVVFKL